MSGTTRNIAALCWKFNNSAAPEMKTPLVEGRFRIKDGTTSFCKYKGLHTMPDCCFRCGDDFERIVVIVCVSNSHSIDTTCTSNELMKRYV